MESYSDVHPLEGTQLRVILHKRGSSFHSGEVAEVGTLGPVSPRADLDYAQVPCARSVGAARSVGIIDVPKLIVRVVSQVLIVVLNVRALHNRAAKASRRKVERVLDAVCVMVCVRT